MRVLLSLYKLCGNRILLVLYVSENMSWRVVRYVLTTNRVGPIVCSRNIRVARMAAT